jgi:hypothetical protein
MRKMVADEKVECLEFVVGVKYDFVVSAEIGSSK